jgi:hypothetical protein
MTPSAMCAIDWLPVLEDAVKQRPPDLELELAVKTVESSDAFVQPGAGAIENRGAMTWATASAHRSDQASVVQRGLHEISELQDLVREAVAAPTSAAARVPANGPPFRSQDPAAIDADIPAAIARALLGELHDCRPLYCIATQTRTLQVVYGSDGTSSREHGLRTELALRLESEHGAVVDGVAAPGATVATSPLVSRARSAAAVLAAPSGSIDPTLPVVMRPAVASVLVASLGHVLSGDAASRSKNLRGAIGRALIAPALSLRDDPTEPRGTVHRLVDDEGQPAHDVQLVSDGRLTAWLLNRAAAASLGMANNGRAQRIGTRVGCAPMNLHVVPGAASALGDYVELSVRLETFRPFVRPGSIDIVVTGSEIRDGVARRSLTPVELQVSAVGLLRRVLAVEDDLVFFPQLEGCGAPSLHFPDLAAVTRP